VRTLAAAPYFYNSLIIGLVLLSFGIGAFLASVDYYLQHTSISNFYFIFIGCMIGSILGGRWSDHVLGKLKAANGGKTNSEVGDSSSLVLM
jgi:putative Mn2+ efflux pump MntP